MKKKLPGMYAQSVELAGVDITKEPMEVGPTCHYFMGGLVVEADTGATTVPGLFGAGECTGGMNGANRLGGNSLSDIIVFGKRAGEYACKYAAAAKAPALRDEEVSAAAAEMMAFLDGPGEDPYDVQTDLQHTMQDLVGDSPGRRGAHRRARSTRRAEAAGCGGPRADPRQGMEPRLAPVP